MVRWSVAVRTAGHSWPMMVVLKQSMLKRPNLQSSTVVHSLIRVSKSQIGFCNEIKTADKFCGALLGGFALCAF